MTRLPAPAPPETSDLPGILDALRARSDRPRIEPELLWLRARPTRPIPLPSAATLRCA